MLEGGFVLLNSEDEVFEVGGWEGVDALTGDGAHRGRWVLR
jgi:hypothetical protein